MRPVAADPIQSSANKRAQVFLFARIFYNITYKLKHLWFQLTGNENCKEHLDQASVCLDDVLCFYVYETLVNPAETGEHFEMPFGVWIRGYRLAENGLYVFGQKQKQSVK